VINGSLLNQDVLVEIIKNEAQKMFALMAEEFQKELTTNYTFDDKLLTRDEVAIKLSVSKGTVDNLNKAGKITACSIGKSVRYRNSEILNYIKRIK
jgi:excisionase family DNA binding protein